MKRYNRPLIVYVELSCPQYRLPGDIVKNFDSRFETLPCLSDTGEGMPDQALWGQVP